MSSLCLLRTCLGASLDPSLIFTKGPEPEWIQLIKKQQDRITPRLLIAKEIESTRKPRSAFQFFLSQNLDKSQPLAQQMKLLGEKWKAMSAKDKEPFQKLHDDATEQWTSTNDSTEKKPKRPRSALTMFLQEHRDEIKQELKKQFGDKIPLHAYLPLAREKYNALSDAAKQKYKDASSVEKNQRVQEMAEFKKRNPKVNPKRVTNYELFCQETQGVSNLAIMWRDMPDQQKRMWQERADAWNTALGASASKKRKTTDSAQDDSNTSKKTKSAWSQFLSSDVRRQVAAENPTLRLGEITKIMAEKWKSLTAEQKRKYNPGVSS